MDILQMNLMVILLEFIKWSPFSVHKESAPPLVPVEEQKPAQTDSADKRDEEKADRQSPLKVRPKSATKELMRQPKRNNNRISHPSSHEINNVQRERSDNEETKSQVTTVEDEQSPIDLVGNDDNNVENCETKLDPFANGLEAFKGLESPGTIINRDIVEMESGKDMSEERQSLSPRHEHAIKTTEEVEENETQSPVFSPQKDMTDDEHSLKESLITAETTGISDNRQNVDSTSPIPNDNNGKTDECSDDINVIIEHPEESSLQNDSPTPREQDGEDTNSVALQSEPQMEEQELESFSCTANG